MKDLASFHQKVLEKVKEAAHKYHLEDLFLKEGQVEISYYKAGTAAGRADSKTNCIDGTKVFKLMFNLFNIENDYDCMVNEIIPHEVAHIVGRADPELADMHDDNWKRVCIALGGNGERTHNMKYKKARKTVQCIYEVDGHRIPVSLRTHDKIQNLNAIYSYKVGYKKLILRPANYIGSTLDGISA